MQIPSSKFGGFVAVGIAMMVGASIANGILIDWLGGPPEIIAPIVLLGFFVLKYYAYLYCKVIEPKFWRYVFTNIALTLISLALVPFLILQSPLNASLSTVIVMAGMVVFRFLVFKSVRLIRQEA